MIDRRGKNQVGAKNPNWKGGRHWHKQSGHWLILVEGHYVQEHRHIAETLIGRKLDSKEVVHHINLDHTDNRPENIQVMLRSDHIALHNRLDPRHINRERDRTGRFK